MTKGISAAVGAQLRPRMRPAHEHAMVALVQMMRDVPRDMGADVLMQNLHFAWADRYETRAGPGERVSFEEMHAYRRKALRFVAALDDEPELAAFARDMLKRGGWYHADEAPTALLTRGAAFRLRCWACGEQATAIYFLIEGDRARSVEGSCDDLRHDLLRQWDIAAQEDDPLVDEYNRRFRGQDPSGYILVAELLDPEEAADWERHLRSTVWGRDALALLRAVGRP
jgi:hypothetical protein